MEAELNQLSTESRIPGLGSLFQTIESFVKLANIPRMRSIMKIRWLLHVDLLFQNTMQERVLHIQLTK
jgi:hypothetical protein